MEDYGYKARAAAQQRHADALRRQENREAARKAADKALRERVERQGYEDGTNGHCLTCWHDVDLFFGARNLRALRACYEKGWLRALSERRSGGKGR